ncbi:MAG: hypothetical protein LUC47_01165 [Clostridiales bacterium]|nr:hypothetical protein [Clostridiales bacterium]
MKRFLFLYAMIIALALSGCGGGSSAAEQQSSGGGTTDTAVQTAEDTSDSETVLVNLVTFMYGEGVTATYTYDSSGNTTSAVYAYTTYSDYTETYYYTYNESGNLAEQDYIYEVSYDGETSSGTETKSEYDATGKLASEEIIYFNSDSDGEETTPYGVFAYSYDGNVGTATATVQSDSKPHTETRVATYNGTGVLLSKEIYYEYEEEDDNYSNRMTYDETGRLTSSITMYSNGYADNWTYNYTDDSEGNPLTISSEFERGVDGQIDTYYYTYYEYSYNEDNELETISIYSSQEEGGTLTLNGIGTYRYHYLDNGLLSSVDGYDEDGEREEDLFYFEYEAAVQLPADEAEAVQEAQTDRIRAFLRGALS